MSPLDRNGVHITPGQRVTKDGREGKVTGTLGLYRVYVRWEGEKDDEIEQADTLITVDSIL